MCAGQASSPPAQIPPSTSAQIIAHGVFPVRVTHAIDSEKLKKGDPIEAETAGAFRLPDGRTIPKGAKLLGHVAIASAKSRGDAKSELALVFDKVISQNVGDLRIKALVQSVYPPEQEQDPGVVNGYTMGAETGGATYVPPDINSGSMSESAARTSIVLDLTFVGVQGVKDLELERIGLLSSPAGTGVKLNKGFRLVVQVVVFG
jgi:hypothetical protein